MRTNIQHPITNLSLFKFAFIILCFFIITSCEKDLYEEPIKQSNLIQKKIISFEEFKSNSQRYSSLLDAIEIQKTKRANGRLLFNANFGFYIDTDNITLIERNGVKSYTFSIVRDNTTEKVENLILNYKSESDYDAYIFKYDLTEYEKQLLENGLPIENIKNKTSIETIEGIEILTTGVLNREIYHDEFGNCFVIDDIVDVGGGMVDIYYVQVACEEGTDSGGSEESTGNGNNSNTATNNNGNYDSNTTINSNNTGQFSGGGSGLSNGSNPLNNDTTILTQPVHGGNFAQVEILEGLINFTLTENERNFLLRNTNLFLVQQINGFLEVNDNNDSQTFIQQIIQQSLSNPTYKFDVAKSFKSPFNIDLTSLQVLTSDLQNIKDSKEKFNFIYNKITSVPQFKTLFLDLFQNNTKYNVKFEIVDNLPSVSNPSMQSDGQTVPDQSNPNNITIQINRKILTGNDPDMKKTNIEIAKTIVHECIHAYLMIKALNPDAGQPIPGVSNMDLPQLLNATYTIGTAQHNFMVNNMVPTLQNILSQVLNSLTSQVKRTECESLIIHPNQITNPSITTTWNWQNYLYYLCLNGLHQTQYFISNFPTSPIMSDAYYLFLQYCDYGNDNLDYNINLNP